MDTNNLKLSKDEFIHNNAYTSFSKNKYQILFIISTILFAVLFFDSINIIIDDTYISARYAKNLVNGYGLVYNPGETPIEGFSNPFYTLFIGFVYFILKLINLDYLIESLILVQVISGLFHLLSIIALISLCKMIFPEDFLKTILVILLYSSNYFLAANASYGLETSQYLLVLLLLFIYLKKIELHKKNIYKIHIGLILGILSISRPESILFIVLMIILSFNLKKFNDYSLSFIILFIIFSLYLTFRIFYFKDFFPNTFYSKMKVFTFGYGLRYLFAGIYYYLAPIFFIVLIKKISLTKSFSNYTMILLIISQFFFILWATGDWIPGFRFIIPIFPILLILSLHFSEKLSINVYFFIILIFLLSGYSISQRYFIGTGPEHKSGLFQLSIKEHPYVQTANYLKKHITSKEYSKTIAIYESGTIPFLVNQKFLDISSINDKHLSRIKALHFEKIDNDYVFSRKPDYIVLYGVLKYDEFELNQVQKALFNDKRLWEQYYLLTRIANTSIILKKK